MFDNPLILQDVYSSIFYVNFHSKMKKLCPLAKNTTDLSARFSNYVMVMVIVMGMAMMMF